MAKNSGVNVKKDKTSAKREDMSQVPVRKNKSPLIKVIKIM